MAEHILFLTGRLAHPRLEKVLQAMQPSDFTYATQEIGKVAGLMTADLIRRRLPSVEADRVIVPGRCRGDLDALTAQFGAPFVRSEEHTSELQSLMRISYAVFCLKKKHL